MIGLIDIPDNGTLLNAALRTLFSIANVAAIVILLIGFYESWKETKEHKPELEKLESKRWYRLVKVVYYLAYFLLLIFILGTYTEEKYYLFNLTGYIFATRLIRKIIVYIYFGKEGVKNEKVPIVESKK